MKEIYLGLDIDRNHMQLTYYDEESGEVESIAQPDNKDTYQLPNLMFYSDLEDKWYVGNEVSLVRFDKPGRIVEDVIGNIGSGQPVHAGGHSYSYGDLLGILIKRFIDDFISQDEERVLSGLTVTIEEYDEDMYESLHKIAEEMNLTTDNFYVMSHENAFFQFAMNQEDKLKTNSIALFEYGVEGLYYYRVDKTQRGNSVRYNIVEEDFSREIPYSKLFEDVEGLDEEFAKLAQKKMKETYISSVYLTGPGFNDSWIDKSAKALCDGRKVFLGQNIYAKGACYHATFGSYEKKHGCILVTPGSISFDIGVNVGDTEEKERFCPIATGGREWYNMRGEVTIFLDDTNRIEMVYRDMVTKEIQKEIIEIHGLPKRPPKTTKLSIEVEMYDEETGAIVIRDMGFGKIYPTTNKIYRKEWRSTND